MKQVKLSTGVLWGRWVSGSFSPNQKPEQKPLMHKFQSILVQNISFLGRGGGNVSFHHYHLELYVIYGIIPVYSLK